MQVNNNKITGEHEKEGQGQRHGHGEKGGKTHEKHLQQIQILPITSSLCDQEVQTQASAVQNKTRLGNATSCQ